MIRQGNFFVVLRILVLARRGSMSNTTERYDLSKLKNISEMLRKVGMELKETANNVSTISRKHSASKWNKDAMLILNALKRVPQRVPT